MPVRETLPLGTLQGNERPNVVVDAHGNAVAVAEVKFRQIAVQMVFGAMLVNALHAALREHEGEQWVFVKGEKAAVKMEQVVAQAAPTTAKLPPMRELPNDPPQQNMPDVRMVGDRLIISADVDLKGLRKLRKQLRMFESMLSMGDDEETDDDA
ncbi:hypothetical protein MPLSOD_10122 [Mesorhizobium sp. SOD10]|nr:hypothetical protein MPLSOD_10122 [Mesorhizobium sp. SOD10]